MVSCPCPYRDYRDYHALAFAAVVASALAVDARVAVGAAVEPEAPAQAVLEPQHARLALAVAYARSASAGRVVVVAVAAVVVVGVAQRDVLHVAPGHDLLAAQHAVVVAPDVSLP